MVLAPLVCLSLSCPTRDCHGLYAALPQLALLVGGLEHAPPMCSFIFCQLHHTRHQSVHSVMEPWLSAHQLGHRFNSSRCCELHQAGHDFTPLSLHHSQPRRSCLILAGCVVTDQFARHTTEVLNLNLEQICGQTSTCYIFYSRLIL